MSEYRTRCGFFARVVCTDRKSPLGFSWVVLVTTSDGTEANMTYRPGGKYDPSGVPNPMDLVPEKEYVHSFDMTKPPMVTAVQRRLQL